MSSRGYGQIVYKLCCDCDKERVIRCMCGASLLHVCDRDKV